MPFQGGYVSERMINIEVIEFQWIYLIAIYLAHILAKGPSQTFLFWSYVLHVSDEIVCMYSYDDNVF